MDAVVDYHLMNSSCIPAEVVPYEHYGLPLSTHLAGPLLGLAPPIVGDRALDLACGTGLVARLVAPLVGLDGLTLGVDVSPAMVEAARVRTAAARLRAVHYVAMDAQALALASASVDVVYCQLGLMLMAEPARAAAQVARVPRPGDAADRRVPDRGAGGCTRPGPRAPHALPAARRVPPAAVRGDPGKRPLLDPVSRPALAEAFAICHSPLVPGSAEASSVCGCKHCSHHEQRTTSTASPTI